MSNDDWGTLGKILLGAFVARFVPWVWTFNPPLALLFLCSIIALIVLVQLYLREPRR